MERVGEQTDKLATVEGDREVRSLFLATEAPGRSMGPTESESRYHLLRDSPMVACHSEAART